MTLENRERTFFAEDESGFLRRWFPPQSMIVKPGVANKMGVRELARAAGVSPTTITRIRRGEDGTSLTNLRKVLPFLSECPCCGKPQGGKP